MNMYDFDGALVNVGTKSYQQGYHDAIDKAYEWLESIARKQEEYVDKKNMFYHIPTWEFRKAMEE